MDHLNKQQLVLLALLLSFVTSIATGIVTVSLVNQAPPAVTQTINRVVERTIEKVVPAQGAAVITRETVVVKSDDAAINSIEKNSASIVRIKTKIDPNTAGNPSAEPLEVFVGLGLVVSKDGIILGDKGLLSGKLNYTGVFTDGKHMLLSPVASDEESNSVLFQAIKDPNAKQTTTFVPATLGDSDTLKLGQSVISVSGKEQNSIAMGIVASLIPKVDASGKKSIGTIETDTNLSGNILGSFLLDLSGNIVGIKGSIDSNSDSRNVYVSINPIKAKLPTLLESLKPRN
ncbi:MAG: serine protease [Patescibacteria group bacterium]